MAERTSAPSGSFSRDTAWAFRPRVTMAISTMRRPMCRQAVNVFFEPQITQMKADLIRFFRWDLWLTCVEQRAIRSYGSRVQLFAFIFCKNGIDDPITEP